MYYLSVKKIKTEVTTKYQNNLIHLVKNADYMLMNIEMELLQLRDDDIFINYKRMTKPGEHVDELISLNKKLSEIKQKNDLIESVYFYDEKQNAIITNEYGSYRTDKFYDMNWFECIKKKNLQTQVIRLNTRLNVDDKIINDEIEMRKNFHIPKYVISIVIRVEGVKDDNKYIVININQEKLYKVLRNMNLFKEDMLFVVDKGGTILLYKNINKILTKLQGDITVLNSFQKDGLVTIEGNVEGEPYLVLSLSSEYNSWKYAFGIPLAVMLKDMNYFKYYILILSIVLIIISGVLAFFIANYLYSPFKDLINSIKLHFLKIIL